MEETTDSLKRRTAGTLKWNVIDRVATQLLYAVTGVVLARELSQDDFGLVGAVLIFQACASLLVDGGARTQAITPKSPNARPTRPRPGWYPPPAAAPTPP